MIICLLAPHGLLLLVEEILHSCRYVVYPIIYRGFTHFQVVGLGIAEPSTAQGKARALESDSIFPSLHHATGLPPVAQRGLLNGLGFGVELLVPNFAQESLQNIATKINPKPP